MSKKVIFSVFENFDFYDNGGYFDVFYMSFRRRQVSFFCARNLIFWLRTPWDMSKKVIFSEFQNIEVYDNGIRKVLFRF